MKPVNVFKGIKEGSLPSVGYMLRKIWDYAGKYSEEYGISRIYLFVDYFICAIIYGCAGDDYFPCRFFLKSRKAKKKYVTLLYERRFEGAHTNASQAAIADNKEEALNVFSDYIKRDWCGTKYNNTDEDFNKFYEKHELGVIKPPCGHGGEGVTFVNIREKFSDGAELKDHCRSHGLLVEEPISQHEAIGRIYPNSINTIRMITLNGECVGTAIRMGVGSAKVDNAHAGGIYAEIDVKEGIIVSEALSDRTSTRSIRHPTTGTVIPGSVIPFWNECKSMVKEAAKLLPDVCLLGWDVAVTPDGPVIVEVNTTPGLGLVQAPNGHELKPEFEKIKD